MKYQVKKGAKAAVCTLALALLAAPALSGCGRPVQTVGHRQSYVPGQQEGLFDQQNPYRAGREFPEESPEGFCFSIHPTERTRPILLRYGGKVSKNGAWVRDAETGEVMAWVENGCPDGQNDNCRHRLFALDGSLLMDWGEEYPYGLLGRWLFVYDREFDPRDGWAVNLDTGEIRFRHYALEPALSAEGIHSLWLMQNAPVTQEERPKEGFARVMLVDQNLTVQRQFGRDDCRAVLADPTLCPGYYILQNPTSAKLYRAAQDLLYPGIFAGFVKGEEPMALFSSPKGWAVYRLDSFERVTELDTGSSPRRYKVYTSAVQIYEQNAARPRQCFLAYPGGLLACDDADWTATGFYAVRRNRVYLFDAQGVQTGLWETSDPWVGSHSGAYWEPPELTVFSWRGGWEARSRQGGCLRGLGECREVRLLEEGRYRLMIRQDGKNTYSLVDTSCRLLLHDLDRLYPTGAPGFWEIRKGMRAGIVDKAGFWCWEIHLENFNDYAVDGDA